MLPPLKAIPIKDRVSLVFIQKGLIDVKDGSFVVIDKNGVRTVIPVGNIACIMLEPGTRVSHAAAVLAGRVSTLLIWVGDGGVRLYAAGQPGGARSDHLMYQARLVLEDNLRLNVVRKMYEMRFKEPPPAKRSIQQLRGIEGARVREIYKQLARQYKVKWKGRNYDPAEWDDSDAINKCISSATACLYGVCEAAVLAAGYSPSMGFIHSGKPLSFVYDVADIYKFDTVIPIAFQTAAKETEQPDRDVRLACRDIFRRTRLMEKIIPDIEFILAAGGIKKPDPKAEVPIAIIEEEKLGDAGHRR